MFVHYVNGLDYIGETKRPFSTGTKGTVPEIQNNVLKVPKLQNLTKETMAP